MAIDLALMQGATKDVEVKGRTFTFSPIHLTDIAEMQKWFVDQPLDDVSHMMKTLGDHMSKEEKLEVTRQARETYEQRNRVVKHLESDRDVIEKVTDDMNSMFSSVEGIKRYMWLSVRKVHSDITMDELGEYVDMQTIGMINELIGEVSFEQKDPDDELKYADYNPEKKTED